jgi:hypothetical protein
VPNLIYEIPFEFEVLVEGLTKKRRLEVPDSVIWEKGLDLGWEWVLLGWWVWPVC